RRRRSLGQHRPLGLSGRQRARPWRRRRASTAEEGTAGPCPRGGRDWRGGGAAKGGGASPAAGGGPPPEGPAAGPGGGPGGGQAEQKEVLRQANQAASAGAGLRRCLVLSVASEMSKSRCRRADGGRRHHRLP